VQPLSYVKKKLMKGQEKREKEYYLANILGIISFFGIAFFLAPLIHDLFHVAALEYFNCYYNFYFSYDWDSEFHSNIQTFCDLSDEKAIIMLGAGIFGTFSISFFLFFLSWFTGKIGKLPESNFLVYPALGFFTDPLFYSLTKKGDILSILEILHKEELLPKIPLIGFVLFLIVLSYLYTHMKHILEDYSRIKKSIKEVEKFISEEFKKS
jgi:hypothetical protein